MPNQSDKAVPLPQRMPASIVGGQLIEESVASFLARHPRVFATCTLTISGSVALNDVLDLTIALPALPGGKSALSVTASGSDDTTTLAQKMAAAICDDPGLRSFGVYATSLLGVVTIKAPGPLWNNAVITHSVSPGSEIETLNHQLSGGSGPVIPFNTFRFPYNKQLFEFQANRPQILADAVVAALAKAGSPIS